MRWSWLRCSPWQAARHCRSPPNRRRSRWCFKLPQRPQSRSCKHHRRHPRRRRPSTLTARTACATADAAGATTACAHDVAAKPTSAGTASPPQSEVPPRQISPPETPSMPEAEPPPAHLPEPPPPAPEPPPPPARHAPPPRPVAAPTRPARTAPTAPTPTKAAPAGEIANPAATACRTDCIPAPAAAIAPGWQNALASWLRGAQDLSREARRRGEQGRAVVRFTVDRGGQVLDVQLVSGTGSTSPGRCGRALAARRAVATIPAPGWTRRRSRSPCKSAIGWSEPRQWRTGRPAAAPSHVLHSPSASMVALLMLKPASFAARARTDETS